MPESIAAVQALLAWLDPNSGDDGNGPKSAKGQVASIAAPPIPNPLDLPQFPPIVPPIVVPRAVGHVNP